MSGPGDWFDTEFILTDLKDVYLTEEEYAEIAEYDALTMEELEDG